MTWGGGEFGADRCAGFCGAMLRNFHLLLLSKPPPARHGLQGRKSAHKRISSRMASGSILIAFKVCHCLFVALLCFLGFSAGDYTLERSREHGALGFRGSRAVLPRVLEHPAS